MVTVTGGDKLLSHLKGMAARLKSADTVSCGFFEGATYPDGTPVAMVAAINNYGSQAASGPGDEGTVQRIPPRPFFTTMVIKGVAHWGEDLGKILPAANMDAKLALGRLGKKMEGELQDSILNGGWTPNAPSTIAAKGFDKPLIHDSIMLRSVSSEVN